MLTQNIFVNKKSNAVYGKILLAVICIAAFAGIVSAQNFIKNSFFAISFPGQQFLAGAGESIFNFFGGEDGKLKKENLLLLANASVLGDLKKENEALRMVLQNGLHEEYKMKIANIAGLDDSQGTMLLDKGLQDGVAEGMPVISAEKAVFGRVTKAYKNFAQVTLISSKNSAIDVRDINGSEETPVFGAVKGLGNGQVFLDTVALDDAISNEDVLVTSGLDGVFPKGLLVGKIIEKIKDDLKPFQTAKIQPYFDPKTTQNLFIITGYKTQ